MMIKFRLMQIGMTQKALAQQISKRQAWLSELSTGKRPARQAADRQAICKVLRCRVGDLFDKSGWVRPLIRAKKRQ